MSYQEFSLKTNKRIEYIDITGRLQEAVNDSGVLEGVCLIHIPHTTAGITINENADPDVVRDINQHLSKLIPAHDHFQHSEGNSDSHIKSTLTNPSLSVIIHKGRLMLGTWQGIYFCEYDGPRSRQVFVKCMKG